MFSKKVAFKKVSIMLIVLMVFSIALTGCSSNQTTSKTDEKGKNDQTSEKAEKKKYALVIKTLNNPNAALMSQGAQDAAAEVGAEVVVMAPEREVDSARQLEIVENLIAQGIDGLLIMPCGSRELVPGVKKANDEGIPVINIDTKLDAKAMEELEAHIETFIGSNNYDAGVLGAESIAKTLGDAGGEIAVIEGVPGHESSDVRVRGFEETIAKYPNIKVVAKQPAYWETDQGFSVIQNIMEANPGLDGVWVASDLMGLGGAQAIEQAGKQGEILMVGVDGMLDAIRSIREGIYTSTVEQSTYMMGYEGIMAAEKYNAGEEFEDVVYTPLTLIDESNVDERLAKEGE